MKNALLILLALLLVMFASQLRANVLQLSAQAQPVKATGYLQRLDDPKGELAPEQALQAAGWRTLPKSLSAGYTEDTIWLRVQVQSQGDARWQVRLSNALLDDVRLYQRDAQGGWQEQHAGENLPRKQWPLDYRSALFALQLPEGEPTLLLLRLQTKNAMSVSLDFAPRQAFAGESRREYLVYGLYFGVYLMLIIFHAVFWRMTRAPESGWYLAYVSLCVWIEALTIGLPQQLLGIPVQWSDPMLGSALALGIPIGVIFAGRQLGLPEVYPKLMRNLAALCWLIGGGATLYILSGHYRDAMPLVQVSALLLVPFFIGLALWLLVRGHRPARFYLLAFGIYYAGVIVSFLRNFGYVPATFWTDHAASLGTMIHMGLMSLRIISHYNRLKRDKEQAQAATAALTLQQKERLETLVAIRTSELSKEIERRALLEQGLRVSLEQEQRIRAEQGDFVAMVSHEFRTPLAIISTSAQQLAKNLNAPLEKSQRRCRNIREASARLLALVDDYLTHDRMAEVQPTLRVAPYDLPILLTSLQAEFPPGRVLLTHHLGSGRFHCDHGLLRVALRNLLANADRHAPAHTQVRLEVDIDEQGCVCLHVYNQGQAIPEDEQARFFQKYYRGRLAQLTPGAGLGLYLVRRIAELHGGEVTLLSAGEQVEICFRLRLALPLEEIKLSAVAPQMA